jgi:hypothetical protein
MRSRGLIGENQTEESADGRNLLASKRRYLALHLGRQIVAGIAADGPEVGARRAGDFATTHTRRRVMAKTKYSFTTVREERVPRGVDAVR